jgi:outer membrane protein assembly factor BamB
MIRAITFIPASSGTEGLTYVERASRNRSLHVLLQDCSFKGTAASHPASRRNFLRNAYREIISRYVSFGRIEHPLPLARSLVGYLESLCKRIDCRVDDFRGIGLYALLQDGETFYLLTSREGRARVRTERGFEDLAVRDIEGVSELPVETTRAQKELFSQDLKDFLALYKIEVGSPGEGALMPLDISLGGSGEEMDTLLEALDQPGVVESGVTEKTIPLNLISDKMMFVRFDGLIRARELYSIGATTKRSRGIGRRSLRVAFPVVAAVALVSLGGIWLSERLARPVSESETAVAQAAPTQSEETAEIIDPPRSEVAPADRSSEAEEAEERGIRFSVAWNKKYNEPVTSTPVFSGDRVFFGSRDRNLYALERGTGEVAWRYRAADGIGASPAVSGNHIIGADYKGNVFAVGAADGKLAWNRKLPGKVVSSPCVGGGEVVVGCYDGTAYALSSETGRVLWRLATGGRVRGTCAFADGRFFIPSYDGRLYAVTAGTVAWRAILGSQVDSSPAIDGDRVVVGAANGRVYGLDASTGRVEWRHQTGAAVKSFIAIFDGKAYVGSNDKALYCLDASSGALLWKFETGGPVLGRAVASEDFVIFPSYDGYVYSVNAETGSEIDRFQTGGAVFSSPALKRGQAFFGNNSGKFYCLNLRGGESS